jgi:hypothetical protein
VTQRGGSKDRVIPTYNPKSAPQSMPNEQKAILKKKMEERDRRPEPEPTINFQYYQPPPPKRQNQGPDPKFYNQIIPQGIMYPPQYGMINQQQRIQVPNIIKNYQINGSNPTNNHESIFLVHEDVMPTTTMTPSFTSIGERLTVYEFIRSSIFSNSDGEDIRLDGGTNSITSFIKFSDVNPHNPNVKFSSNPYKGLPNGFLLYRSCYPIRFDNETNGTMCAKDASDVNVRIYQMYEESYSLHKKSNNDDYSLFDEWREVSFYEFIREKILKTKMCPNFANMFGYFLSKDSNIDYNKIINLKDGPDRIKKEKYITTKLPTMEKTNTMIREINPKIYLGKSLVMLTEASTHSLFNWARKTYSQRGNVKEMVNRGIHTEKEWSNVLFQIMVALYTMQLKNILIKNFSFEHNVFIRDLFLSGQVTNYWKYIVDGVNYYIPNLGYLAIIDSNFRDLSEKQTSTFNKSDNKNKLEGAFLGNACKMSNDDIKKEIFDLFKNEFSPNTFTKDFTENGGCKPPDKIIDKLTNIHNEAMTDTNYDIKKYIVEYMKEFMHNRIGTYLTKTEIDNIRTTNGNKKKGDLFVYEDYQGEYKIVMYIDTDSEGNKCSVMTKNNHDDEDKIIINLNVHDLKDYSKSEPIAQTFDPGNSNLNESNMLETYIVEN